MRSFHQAIEREDVTLLEALLIKYQTTVFKSLYYNLHYFDLWNMINQRTLCQGQWNQHLEEMVLLLLKYRYPANYLVEYVCGLTFIRTWNAVSIESSSVYLLRCYGDLGDNVVNPDWYPPDAVQRVIDFGEVKCKPLDVERKEKLKLLRSVWSNWSLEDHKNFPRSFRLTVFTFLLVRKRDSLIRHCIDKHIAYFIFHKLAHTWCRDRLPIEHIWSLPILNDTKKEMKKPLC
jgi:hypothetical protein